MIRDPSPLDLSSLEKALVSLESALEITRSEEFQELDERWRNTLLAGVVQNFKSTFELSWQMLKRQLERELPNLTELDTMSDSKVIRTGHERGLIDDPLAWFDYRLLRGLTSQVYSESKVRQVYEGVPAFITSVHRLLGVLEQRNAD